MRIYFFGVCVKVNSSLLNAILFRILIKEKYIDFAEQEISNILYDFTYE